MRFSLRLVAAVVLAAIGIGGLSTASAADRDARAAVAARQKIRAELSAALAKGNLTRMDQYRILLHAKEILTADDFSAFERTLDRIAASENNGKPTARHSRKQTPAAEPSDDDATTVVPSRYEEPNAAEAPKVLKARPSGENPFVEEVPAGISGRSMQPSDCCMEEGCEAWEGPGRRRWLSVDLFSAVEGFKGPLDVGNANGNFGVRLGLNSALAVLPRLGVGLQAGVAEEMSNIKGSPYPVPNAAIRNQLFTTVGMFQRLRVGEGEGESSIGWGFAYDWLFDDYYSNFTFGQWRAKLALELSPCNEIGLWAAIPERSSTGELLNIEGQTDQLRFKPITQGCLYWKHTWCNEASMTGRFGLAERPGEFIFGAESRVPVTERMAVTGGFTYIMPQAGGGPVGQTQEMWNVSVGIEFVPGGFHRGCGRGVLPFLPVADNGSLAIQQVGP